MNDPQKPQPLEHPAATYVGLAVALVVLPAFVAGFRLINGDSHSDLQVVSRELGVFVIVGLLLWIVKAWERLSLNSIGVCFGRFGKSALWGLALAVISLTVTVGMYLIFQRFGVHLGGGDSNSFRPSLWVVTLSMLRAGVAEEIFYRGYAIERLQSLTGSKWLAGLVPLVMFAGAHYRQGIGGVIATFILGGVLTIFYMKRRDLVANITGHFLADFVLNVVLPLLGG